MPISMVMIGALGLSCGSGKETVTENQQEAPIRQEGGFSVDFPSVAAAVAAETLQVQAFEVTGERLCQKLLELRKSGQDMPLVAAQTPPLRPCQFASAKDEATRIELPLDKRFAFLAVAQRGKEDLMLGCGTQDVTRTKNVVPVSLALAEQKSIPTTTCTTLSQHCASGCN
jgi:hypothetical protein